MKENITLDSLKHSKGISDTLEHTENEIAKVTEHLAQISEKDRVEIDRIKDDIDLLDSNYALAYGQEAQKNLSNFSETILSQVKAKDAGYVGTIMSDLMTKVRSLDIESFGERKDSLLDRLPFIKNIGDNMKNLMTRYESLEGQIVKIESELDVARIQMIKDISMLDTLYQKNLDYFNQLQLYIIAGEEKLQEMREETLPRLREEAAISGDAMNAQLVSDFEDTVNRFEKKVHDLKLSKTLSIQTAPQIKLIQNNDKQLVDKIQTAILHTIPLWKSQMVIALGLYRQDNALRMQREVTNTTNELLRRNSEALKQSSINVAKEAETGIVEIDTLKKVNTDLIETIDETLKIHAEGRQKRVLAEQELLKIEDELKNTLLRTRQ